MEPIASEMIQKDKNLREEFYSRLERDEEFKNDPVARLEFFYLRSAYVDTVENVYPIMRITEPLVFARISHSLS